MLCILYSCKFLYVTNCTSRGINLIVNVFVSNVDRYLKPVNGMSHFLHPVECARYNLHLVFAYLHDMPEKGPNCKSNLL